MQGRKLIRYLKFLLPVQMLFKYFLLTYIRASQQKLLSFCMYVGLSSITPACRLDELSKYSFLDLDISDFQSHCMQKVSS